uniref:Sodium/hydrogen exchanger 8 n=1 Tax=Neogobius melanostomus TaxID=47308 RepID=A0A8C6TC46_9GOBI
MKENKSNGTDVNNNGTLHLTTSNKPSTLAPPTAKPILPVQTGVKAQEEEQSNGLTIFFSLLVIGICIILVHLLIKFKLHFLPESVAVVSLGILMGGFIKIIEFQELANWKEEEMFRPNMFFLLLLPPIIFESGYSLHKGNFFQNIGSITLFAVIGTAISAFIVGGGIYFLGQADVIYKMTMTDSFAFGSLISAVDPVATIAIFNALNVDPVLNMLVFGESILNDAVSIVLTNTAEGFFSQSDNSMVTGWEIFIQALGYFLKMFFGSAALGTLTGLISAVFLKHFDLFPHKFEISFVIWCILDNPCLRGAIPYALSLHLGLEPIEKRQLIGTTTIIIVLFTILLMGGGTMPLIRIMDIEESQSRRKNKKDVNLSKTQKMGNTIESEHLSELTEEEYEAHIYHRQDLKGFMWLDAKYLNPFFTRRLTQEDLLHGRIQMKTLTNKWYEEVRQGPSGSEDEEDEAELL